MITIKYLNESSNSEFVETLKDIYEHSPWIPEKALQMRPISSFEDLHEKLVLIVEEAAKEDQLALIKAHPNLGTRLEMSSSSVQEQKGAGLSQLTPEEFKNFTDLNNEYMNKFGFPFIMAVKGRSKDEIYKAMKDRVNNDLQSEFATALQEIFKIARFRLTDLIAQ